jgi:hypothetical protein
MANYLENIEKTISYGLSYIFNLSVENKNELFGIDMSIEGLRSQEYSVGIFIFLVISLIFFAFIIWLYVPKGKKSLKTGEKIMFGSIIAGIFIAIAMGYVQLVDGYLL